MQKSFLVKTPVHFADFGFFVKVGDILVHDVNNASKLTVYRNGEVIKAVKQTALGIAAMEKNGFIVEVAHPPLSPKTALRTQAKPIPEVKPKPKIELLEGLKPSQDVILKKKAKAAVEEDT